MITTVIQNPYRLRVKVLKLNLLLSDPFLDTLNLYNKSGNRTVVVIIMPYSILTLTINNRHITVVSCLLINSHQILCHQSMENRPL